jgi:hypothetical protein
LHLSASYGIIEMMSPEDNRSLYENEIHHVKEPNERSALRPFEPTPLEPRLVDEHQREVQKFIWQLLDEKPSYISDELADFINIMYMSRDANRSVKNTESFVSRLVTDIQPDCQDIVEKAKRGLAEPDELLEMMVRLGMPSVELAKLTHVYGYRLDHIDTMREYVKQAIPDITYSLDEEYKVRACDNPQQGAPKYGILMTRKRLIALEPVSVFERSSFVVNLNSDALDGKLRSRLKSYELNAQNDKTWTQDILRHCPDLVPSAKQLVEDGNLEAMIPISTTIYAASSEIEQLIVERDKQERMTNGTKVNFLHDSTNLDV